MGRSRKRMPKKEFSDIELNIVPFIDVFSMLNTFLLFSAVFVATGILEVQVPFLSSAPPPKEENTRFFSVKIDVAKDKIEVITAWSQPPDNQDKKKQFNNNKDGFKELHSYLVQVRRENPKNDKLTMFCEDDVIWENIAGILDTVKYRAATDPVFQTTDKDGKPMEDKENLFPKIVMGSVIL